MEKHFQGIRKSKENKNIVKLRCFGQIFSALSTPVVRMFADHDWVYRYC